MLVLDIIDPRILSLPICGSAILERYQEAPHLLDPHLESITNPLIKVARDLGAPPARQTAVFSIIYLLTKVRGYKTVLKLFSHDAADFHPVLHRLLDGAPLSLNEANASLSPNEASTDAWKTCYILLLWMSLICMLPFNMKVLDSGGAESDVQKILRLCKVYLRVTDKAREGAAVLVSLITNKVGAATGRCRERQCPHAIGVISSVIPQSFGWIKRITPSLRITRLRLHCNPAPLEH